MTAFLFWMAVCTCFSVALIAEFYDDESHLDASIGEIARWGYQCGHGGMNTNAFNAQLDYILKN